MPFPALAALGGGGITDAFKGFAAGPAGPSQSGDIAGSSGVGIAPVTIAGMKANANAPMGIPMWVWIGAAAVAFLFALRKK